MRVMMVGDVVGAPGRRAFARYTPALRRDRRLDLVIANGENSAAGKGIVRKTFDELIDAGADVVTSGNHIWSKQAVLDLIDSEPRLLRPANYPEGAPGRGACVLDAAGLRLAVVNLAGRAFMQQLDCPFRLAEAMLADLSGRCDAVLVDFHAEATSEKAAMGWLLDGKAAAVAGTHTHVQTADEVILPGGTAYITDLGMVGPWLSVIGTDRAPALRRMVTAMPARFTVADGPCVYGAAIIDLDSRGRARAIERVLIREPADDGAQ